MHAQTLKDREAGCSGAHASAAPGLICLSWDAFSCLPLAPWETLAVPEPESGLQGGGCQLLALFFTLQTQSYREAHHFLISSSHLRAGNL